MKNLVMTNCVNTVRGKVPKVDTHLSWADKLGTFKARFTIGRMEYKVQPGLYAVGNPGPDSIVLVSANYKMSFDALRRELTGLNAWIMALDTKCVNVWCAAGKGTFGTEEIVNRIELTELKEVVNHRKLIVPQLGAPGVAAHEVRRLSGFSVIYGPIRAADIPAFIKRNMQATPQMRQVKFSFYDRLVLVPAEIAGGKTYLFFIILFFFLLSGLSKNGYSGDLAVRNGVYSLINLLLAYLAGAVIGPLLLPWLPGRSFSMKGAFAGLGMFMISWFYGLAGHNVIEITAWGLLICGLSSFITMNFTGASTYTSLSGVLKEMKIALQLQIVAAVTGIGLWLAARFI